MPTAPTVRKTAAHPIADHTVDAIGRRAFNYYFSGLRNAEEDSDGNRTLYFIDTKDSFSLDAHGNRTGETRTDPQAPLDHPTENVSFTYNPQKNRLTSTGPDTFSYDLEGRQIDKTGTAYGWDFEHRLTSLGTTQYFYDGTGNRLKVTRGAVTTKYLYDATGNLLAEADNSGVITKYYLHGLGLLGLITPSNQTYAYHFDATGHTVALTDQSQAIVNRYSYDAYGRTINQTEGINQPFKYVGQYGVMTEAEGVLYMRARYYDPTTGRFISEDPVGFEGGQTNLYAYVGGNPIMRVDPGGLLSYLVSRPLDGFGGASHNFVVTNADYLGDPAATVFSYGMNASGNVGRVTGSTTGFSRGTHSADQAFWGGLGGPSANVSAINAPDSRVAGYANSLIENQDYAAFAGPFGANSNSAAQAIANRAAGGRVNTPGGWRLSPGAGSAGQIQFNKP
jgi:RHS repeat-associated protein